MAQVIGIATHDASAGQSFHMILIGLKFMVSWVRIRVRATFATRGWRTSGDKSGEVCPAVWLAAQRTIERGTPCDPLGRRHPARSSGRNQRGRPVAVRNRRGNLGVGPLPARRGLSRVCAYSPVCPPLPVGASLLRLSAIRVCHPGPVARQR